MFGMYNNPCQSLTLLAAVVLVVFDHELFELSQQLHRLLPDKQQTNTQNQQRGPDPQSGVQADYDCLHNQWTAGLYKRQITRFNLFFALLSVMLLV